MADLKSHPETNTMATAQTDPQYDLSATFWFFPFLPPLCSWLPAGLNWIDAILFWIGYFLISLVSGLYLIKIDSNLMKERQNAISRKNVQPWDRLDPGRQYAAHHRFVHHDRIGCGTIWMVAIPVIIRITGGVLMLLSFALTLWASRTNTFMSSQVRIQAERGHQVISSGPYAVIRHPMYAGMCMLDVGMPLLLNSWYGLIQ